MTRDKIKKGRVWQGRRSMACPYCGSNEFRVTHHLAPPDNYSTVRVRSCLDCGKSGSTIETIRDSDLEAGRKLRNKSRETGTTEGLL